MRRGVDMTSGGLFKKILFFSLPLILTNLLQIVYNMADMVVVGRFSSVDGAVGAIGSTTSFVSLMNNFVFGIGAGATVVVAQAIGARDKQAASRGVHTSVIVGVVLGVLSTVIGELLCRPLLLSLDTAPEYMGMAVTYCRICFIGLPFVSVLNCVLGVMRAQGNTIRPLIILSAVGLFKMVLNIVLVAAFGMDVDGVAISTVVSNVLSAVAALVALTKDTGICAFRLSQLKPHMGTVKRLLAIGVPSGVQGMLFSAANLVVQVAVNSFGPAMITASSIATNLEAFSYTTGNSVSTAALTFAGQNAGAKNYRRIIPVLYNSFAVAALLSGVFSVALCVFQQPLAGLYMNASVTNRSEILQALKVVMALRVLFIPLCATMECGAFTLRGMGYSSLSMINSLVGAGLLRIVWIMTVFAAYPLDWVLFLNYPITWIITSAVQFFCVHVACRRKLAQSERMA